MDYYVSENWSFDPEKRLLKRHNQSSVTLPPKPALLLELLCKSNQELLTSSQIIEQIWDGNLGVAEQGIRQVVLRLRKEIPVADDDQPAVINIPRKGYKLRDTVERSSIKTPKKSVLHNLVAALSIASLAVLIALLWVIFNDEPQPSMIAVHAVTLAGGFEESAAISPDNRSLMYVAESSGQFDMYQKDLLTPNVPDRLFLKKSGNQGGIAWSSDGTRFAYLSTSDDPYVDDVLVYDLKTGAQTLIGKQYAPTFSKAPFGLAWSPNDDRIAYTSITGNGTRFAIFLYDLVSGERDQLTQPDYIDMHPAFSADGEKISFLRISNPELSRLFEIDIASKNERSLSNSDEKIYGNVWLDQSRILYSTWDKGFFYPYVVDVNSLDRVRIPIAGNFKFPETSDEDVYFIRSLVERKIDIYGFSAGELMLEDSIDAIGNQRDPAVHSATGRVVFVSDRAGENQLWLRERNGAEALPLPIGKSVPDYVSISEGGSLVLFRYKNPDIEQTELAIFDLENQSLIELPIENPLIALFSGDDRYIAYMVLNETSRQLWLYDLLDGDRELISEGVWTPIGADQSANTVYYLLEGRVHAYEIETGQDIPQDVEPAMSAKYAIEAGILYLFRQDDLRAEFIAHDLTTHQERVLGSVDAQIIDQSSFFDVDAETERVFISVISKNESDIYRFPRSELEAFTSQL